MFVFCFTAEYVFTMRPRTKGMGERGEILDAAGNFVRTRRSIVRAAKALRKRETDAESLLWHMLRKAAPRGLKFYRQAPIDRFIADFYCPRKKLVIEVDGGIHDTEIQQERDALREAFLQTKGLRVLRFRNEEVTHDVHAVWICILQACGAQVHVTTSNRQKQNNNIPPPHLHERGQTPFSEKSARSECGGG